MELLDCYLAAVRSYLPEEQQNDIIAELSEDLRAQIEDKAAALGRPLTEAELEVIFKRHGHPVFVAGHYLPHQYLIGPSVFPVYWFTLRTTLWITLIVLITLACMTPFVAGLIASLGGNPVPEALQSPGPIFWGSLTILLAICGAVTLLFAFIERFPTRYAGLKDWTVRSLRPLPQVPFDTAGRPMSRAKSIALLGICVVWTACWIAFPDFPIIVAPAAAVLQPAVGWQTFRVCLLLFPLLGVAEACLNLARSRSTRDPLLFPVMRLAGLLVLLFVARNGNLVQAANRDIAVPGLDTVWVATTVNSGIYYGVLLAICFGLLAIATTHARKSTGLRAFGRRLGVLF